MAFDIKVKTDDKDKTKKKIGVDITQDGKQFYSVTHTWTGIPEKDLERFNGIMGALLGSVGITETGDGVVGPVDEDSMIAFEIGMTAASKALNVWAIEDADGKGREVSKAKRALASLEGDWAALRGN